jgi:hypothetical protein
VAAAPRTKRDLDQVDAAQRQQLDPGAASASSSPPRIARARCPLPAAAPPQAPRQRPRHGRPRRRYAPGVKDRTNSPAVEARRRGSGENAHDVDASSGSRSTPSEFGGGSDAIAHDVDVGGDSRTTRNELGDRNGCDASGNSRTTPSELKTEMDATRAAAAEPPPSEPGSGNGRNADGGSTFPLVLGRERSAARAPAAPAGGTRRAAAPAARARTTAPSGGDRTEVQTVSVAPTVSQAAASSEAPAASELVAPLAR